MRFDWWEKLSVMKKEMCSSLIQVLKFFIFSPGVININSFDFVDLVKNSSSLPFLANQTAFI